MGELLQADIDLANMYHECKLRHSALVEAVK